MKILVVEDEPNVVSFLRRGLTEAGHVVSVALDGQTAWDMLQNDTPDVIIMDVMLPLINGIELCRKVRSAGIETPIIMLTALGTSENVVSGLESGADDYVVKPFKVSELLARIVAVTRRSSGNMMHGNTIRIADLCIDSRGKSVERGDVRINLTATEYNLLEFLARNKGRVFSRAEILDRVWDINHEMNTNVVDVYINYLRRKIDHSSSKKLIHTVVGMGYVLREEQP
jgi:DNA-binding response OmpR family regulator